MLSPILWIFGGLLTVYVAIVGLMYFFQSHLIYHPTKSIPATPGSFGINYEDVHFQAQDGTKLHGWYVPAGKARGTVLFQHGNAGNISGRLETIDMLNKMNLNVFIYDYRGYGRSGGSTTEQGTYQDAMAAWKHLTEKIGEQPQDIVLMGRSLGGGVTSWLATKVTPAAVILESTFLSAPDLAADLYPIFPARQMVSFKYPNKENIRQINVPLLIGHSTEDDLIPYEHGHRLFQLANEPKQFFEMQGDHGNGFLQTGKAYVQALSSFFDKVFKTKNAE